MANVTPGASGTRQSPAGGVATVELGHILLVDDEESVRAVTAMLLQRRGYLVTEAQNGDEALQHFVSAPDRFALLLIDLSMPGMDGAELLAAVRRLRPSQFVIAISGHDRRDVVRALGDLRVNGFLQKPFTPETLFAMVGRLTGEPGGRR